MYFYTGFLALLLLQTTQSASTTVTEEATTVTEEATTVTEKATTVSPTVARNGELTVRSEYTSCTSASADNNGVLEIGCWGYRTCVNGNVLRHYCADGYVFDRATFRCVRIGSGSTECGKYVNCTGIPTSRYADVSGGCATFYWCVFGRFVGRFYCPADLVFDETIQVCNYRRDVAPPCGSKTIRA